MSIKEIEGFIRDRMKVIESSDKERITGINCKKENTEKLYKNIVDINQLWDIPLNENITSHRKIIGKPIVLTKKVVKKLLFWLVLKPLHIQKNFNGAVTRSLNELYNITVNNEFEKRVEEINTKFSGEIQELKVLLGESNRKLELLSNKDDFEINYLEFENKFRGTESQIKEKQLEVYLPILEGQVNKNIVDVGCGRGELVDGLTEYGYNIIGIDLNKQMVDYCVQKGSNVVYADALEYLNNFDNDSLGAIFSLHVFEHLLPNQIVSLLNLFYKKIEPGGKVILETPNAECLFTLAYGFSMDLTHRKILHPYTMKFILEDIGFKNVRIKHLNPIPEEARLGKLDSNIDNSIFNENMEKINKLLYGYQDYAIIAEK